MPQHSLLGSVGALHEGCMRLKQDAQAQVLATTNEKPGIVYADLDYAEIETRRLNMPIADQKRSDLYALVDKAAA